MLAVFCIANFGSFEPIICTIYILYMRNGYFFLIIPCKGFETTWVRGLLTLKHQRLYCADLDNAT